MKDVKSIVGWRLVVAKGRDEIKDFLTIKTVKLMY
jgi:hypothetical protein